MQKVDSSGWAVVNNPDPKDRLHLRTAPSKNADSLGKYYNNTPVRVLGEKGDWLRVSVFGIEGYMMRQYLATGEAMNSVETAGLWIAFAGHAVGLYLNPQSEHPFFSFRDPGDGADMRIIGIVGDEWYHVWCEGGGLSGYVRQSDMWPGKG